jgi:hypothetical protein
VSKSSPNDLYTIKKNTETLIDAGKGVGLEVNAEKTKYILLQKKKTPWSESASDRRLSAKLVPTFADRGCHVVSMTDPYGRILGFLDRIYCYLITKIQGKITI